MMRRGRWMCAALLTGALVLAGSTRAAATAEVPSVLVVPMRPASTQAPSNPGVALCPPVIGCDPLGLGADAASAIVKAVFNDFGTFVAEGVGAVLQQVSTAITQTTQVTLNAHWFEQHFDLMRSLAVLVLLPMMLVGLISAIIRRDAHQLLRAGVVYVPVAILGAAAAILVTERALQLTDWATTAVTGDLNGSTTKALAILAKAVAEEGSTGHPDVGVLLAIFVLLIVMAGALLIWIELLLRAGAIYVVVLFLPLAMSGLVWRGSVQWTRRMIEGLVALILSKFVIVVVIDLAAGMITAGGGIATVMQGATLLLLAACAPFALLRLVPMVEASVIGQFEGMEHRTVAAAKQAATAVVLAAVGGPEGAAAGAAVEANGGGEGANLNRESGGQLNTVKPPGGEEDPGGPPPSPSRSDGFGDQPPPGPTNDGPPDDGSNGHRMAEATYGN
jgi:hypothetical protein